MKKLSDYIYIIDVFTVIAVFSPFFSLLYAAHGYEGYFSTIVGDKKFRKISLILLPFAMCSIIFLGWRGLYIGKNKFEHGFNVYKRSVLIGFILSISGLIALFVTRI